MWYAIQVHNGSEEKLKTVYQNRIPKEVLDECFIFYREEMKKYLGEWHKEEKILFPGYLFMGTDQPTELFDTLKKMPVPTRPLGDKDTLVPLTASEAELMKKLGGEKHVVKMSQGVIENGRTQITEGPMIGMEKYIRKIDRHKRRAVIEMKMAGERAVKAEVGVEIVRKS